MEDGWLPLVADCFKKDFSSSPRHWLCSAFTIAFSQLPKTCHQHNSWSCCHLWWEKCLTFVILEVTDFKSPHTSEKIWVRSTSPCLLKTGANKLPAHIYSGKNSLWSDSFYQSGVESINTGPRSSYTVFSTEKAKLCQTIVLE